MRRHGWCLFLWTVDDHMRVWVVGASGMLGRAVVETAIERGLNFHATARAECDILDLGRVHAIANDYQPDAIINCVGLRPGASPIEMTEVNAVGPHILASTGRRLVHMSTDCVYSGRNAPDKDFPDAADMYGRTKLAGESLLPNVLNVRGSFIGYQHGFFRWVLDASGEVKGWTQAYWNGGSAASMADALLDLAARDVTGVVHVGATEPWAKGALLAYIAKRCNPTFAIQYVDEPRINRFLKPDYALPPIALSVGELIEEWKALQSSSQSDPKPTTAST